MYIDMYLAMCIDVNMYMSKKLLLIPKESL